VCMCVCVYRGTSICTCMCRDCQEFLCVCLSEFVRVHVGLWKKECRIVYVYVGSKSESSRSDWLLTQFDLLTTKTIMKKLEKILSGSQENKHLLEQ